MVKKSFLIRLAITFIAIAAFFFIRGGLDAKRLESDEVAFQNELNQHIVKTQTILKNLSQETYLQNRNFPTEMLEGGIRETEEAKKKIALWAETAEKQNGLRESRIIFTRLAAMIFLERKSPPLQEAFAVIDETEKELTWWFEYQEAIKELMAYNPELDLKNRSVDFERRDFIKRLYLAKGGLLRMAGRLEIIERSDKRSVVAALLDLNRKTVALIDNLIRATNEGRREESSLLRTRYISRINTIKRNIADTAHIIYPQNRFSALYEQVTFQIPPQK